MGILCSWTFCLIISFMWHTQNIIFRYNNMVMINIAYSVIMCCFKPLGSCTKWSSLSRNFSPNVIFLWFRGYLSDLLGIRVIITTVIYHCPVTVQELVNRGFSTTACRINHVTLLGEYLGGQEKSGKGSWHRFHLWVPMTYGVWRGLRILLFPSRPLAGS